MADNGKAAFKAIREQVGITQSSLAGQLGVQVRSVKRWEDPNSPQLPPDDAWNVLEAALERQNEGVAAAIEAVMAIADEQGSFPEHVELKYWLSEGDYLQWSTDADLGVASDWRMANANARACAAALESRDIEVVFRSGSPV